MNTERNKVVLVDKEDHVIGQMDKLKAHQQGLLHRAFSVFIFNDRNELLLQQRAAHKYHGAGLWSNTCCSHPQWEEEVLSAARQRLHFEMGLQCNLQFSYAFVYKAEVENGLIEHEYDHVFVGYSNESPKINRDEVQAFHWSGLRDVQQDLHRNPHHYTFWFKRALPLLLVRLEKCTGWENPEI